MISEELADILRTKGYDEPFEQAISSEDMSDARSEIESAFIEDFCLNSTTMFGDDTTEHGYVSEMIQNIADDFFQISDEI